MIKNIIGLRFWTRTKALLNELKIESIKQLYLKHKIFGLKQFNNNLFTKEIILYLEEYYDGKDTPRQSLISQLKEVEEFTGINFNNLNESIALIDGQFLCNDTELRNLVFTTLRNYNISTCIFINIDIIALMHSHVFMLPT